ncbi:MAG: hypothetical protein M0D57_12225 [Sphingobacteriales bacterium JAD_PAG50586_3]|nr:MAG: hypothetical protein M0D57_12225 [Sphingobacteriales bacterium JAD_PAG50586_3]
MNYKIDITQLEQAKVELGKWIEGDVTDMNCFYSICNSDKVTEYHIKGFTTFTRNYGISRNLKGITVDSKRILVKEISDILKSHKLINAVDIASVKFGILNSIITKTQSVLENERNIISFASKVCYITRPDLFFPYDDYVKRALDKIYPSWFYKDGYYKTLSDFISNNKKVILEKALEVKVSGFDYSIVDYMKKYDGLKGSFNLEVFLINRLTDKYFWNIGSQIKAPKLPLIITN